MKLLAAITLSLFSLCAYAQWPGNLTVAGFVLRNPGTGWAIHGDGHIPIPATGLTITNDDRYIWITQPDCRVSITVIATADNDLASRGIVTGVSGGCKKTAIGLYNTVTREHLNPNSVTTATIPLHNIWVFKLYIAESQ